MGHPRVSISIPTTHYPPATTHQPLAGVDRIYLFVTHTPCGRLSLGR